MPVLAFRGAEVKSHQVTCEESEDPWYSDERLRLTSLRNLVAAVLVGIVLSFSFDKVILLKNISGYEIRLLCNDMNYIKL
jgi:hypothetical protein